MKKVNIQCVREFWLFILVEPLYNILKFNRILSIIYRIGRNIVLITYLKKAYTINGAADFNVITLSLSSYLYSKA